MDKWKPDENILKKIEEAWSSEMDLDAVMIDGSSLSEEDAKVDTVRSAVSALREDRFPPEIVLYLERNYNLDDRVHKGSYTGRQVIEEMRKGTPLGVMRYVLMQAHWDCCGPGRKKV